MINGEWRLEIIVVAVAVQVIDHNRSLSSPVLRYIVTHPIHPQPHPVTTVSVCAVWKCSM